MKTWISLSVFFTVFTVFADNSLPNPVKITGKFQFRVVDSNEYIRLGDHISSASEITSSSACLLNFSAVDDYSNSYSGGLNIVTEESGNILPYFQIKSQYIDENNLYWTRIIEHAVYTAGAYKVSSEIWSQEIIKDNHFLFSPSIDQGLIAFHELSMGQPLFIEITKEEQPKNIILEVAPLSSKTASLVRKCFKLIDENAVIAQSKSNPIMNLHNKSKEQVLGENVKSKIRYALELYSKNDFKKAIKTMANVEVVTPYEEAYVARFIGVLLASSGNNISAITHLHRAVKLNLLKVNDHTDSLKLLADLNLSESKYSAALKSYNAWLAITGNDATVIQDRLDKIKEGLNHLKP